MENNQEKKIVYSDSFKALFQVMYPNHSEIKAKIDRGDNIESFLKQEIVKKDIGKMQLTKEIDKLCELLADLIKLKEDN